MVLQDPPSLLNTHRWDSTQSVHVTPSSLCGEVGFRTSRDGALRVLNKFLNEGRTSHSSKPGGQ